MTGKMDEFLLGGMRAIREIPIAELEKRVDWLEHALQSYKTLLIVKRLLDNRPMELPEDWEEVPRASPAPESTDQSGIVMPMQAMPLQEDEEEPPTMAPYGQVPGRNGKVQTKGRPKGPYVRNRIREALAGADWEVGMSTVQIAAIVEIDHKVIAQLLNRRQDLFERVSHGYYRLKSNRQPSHPDATFQPKSVKAPIETHPDIKSGSAPIILSNIPGGGVKAVGNISEQVDRDKLRWSREVAQLLRDQGPLPLPEVASRLGTFSAAILKCVKNNPQLFEGREGAVYLKEGV